MIKKMLLLLATLVILLIFVILFKIMSDTTLDPFVDAPIDCFNINAIPFVEKTLIPRRGSTNQQYVQKALPKVQKYQAACMGDSPLDSQGRIKILNMISNPIPAPEPNDFSVNIYIIKNSDLFNFQIQIFNPESIFPFDNKPNMVTISIPFLPDSKPLSNFDFIPHGGDVVYGNWGAHFIDRKDISLSQNKATINFVGGTMMPTYIWFKKGTFAKLPVTDYRRNMQFPLTSSFLSCITTASFPTKDGSFPEKTILRDIKIVNSKSQYVRDVNIRLFNQSSVPTPKVTYEGIVSCGKDRKTCDWGTHLPPELQDYFHEVY